MRKFEKGALPAAAVRGGATIESTAGTVGGTMAVIVAAVSWVAVAMSFLFIHGDARNGTLLRPARKTTVTEEPPPLPPGAFTFTSRALPDGVVGGRKRSEAGDDVVQLVLTQSWDEKARARLDGGTCRGLKVTNPRHRPRHFAINSPRRAFAMYPQRGTRSAPCGPTKYASSRGCFPTSPRSSGLRLASRSRTTTHCACSRGRAGRRRGTPGGTPGT